MFPNVKLESWNIGNYTKMHISYKNRLIWQIQVTHPLAAIIYCRFTYPWRFTRVPSVILVACKIIYERTQNGIWIISKHNRVVTQIPFHSNLPIHQLLIYAFEDFYSTLYPFGRYRPVLPTVAFVEFDSASSNSKHLLDWAKYILTLLSGSVTALEKRRLVMYRLILDKKTPILQKWLEGTIFTNKIVKLFRKNRIQF